MHQESRIAAGCALKDTHFIAFSNWVITLADVSLSSICLSASVRFSYGPRRSVGGVVFGGDSLAAWCVRIGANRPLPKSPSI
jgi:hypothetical protein